MGCMLFKIVSRTLDGEGDPPGQRRVASLVTVTWLVFSYPVTWLHPWPGSRDFPGYPTYKVPDQVGWSWRKTAASGRNPRRDLPVRNVMR